MRLDFDLEALASRIVHDVIQPGQLRRVERPEIGELQSLPQKRESDHIESFGRVVIDLLVRWVGIVLSVNPRHCLWILMAVLNVAAAEFRPGKIYSKQKRSCH